MRNLGIVALCAALGGCASASSRRRTTLQAFDTQKSGSLPAHQPAGARLSSPTCNNATIVANPIVNTNSRIFNFAHLSRGPERYDVHGQADNGLFQRSA
jgi:hypothetical protein